MLLRSSQQGVGGSDAPEEGLKAIASNNSGVNTPPSPDAQPSADNAEPLQVTLPPVSVHMSINALGDHVYPTPHTQHGR
jgi:hypothetical protein